MSLRIARNLPRRPLAAGGFSTSSTRAALLLVRPARCPYSTDRRPERPLTDHPLTDRPPSDRPSIDNPPIDRFVPADLAAAPTRPASDPFSDDHQRGESFEHRESFERHEPPPPPGSSSAKWLALTGVATFTAVSAYFLLRPGLPEQEPAPRPRKRKARSASSADAAARELIASQQAQVTDSWSTPGVWVWGDNSGRVADPFAAPGEPAVRAPRRLSFFDGQVLRHVCVARNAGVAVTERGDVVQWGLGFSPADPRPATTLAGKDIVKADLSADRVVALSRSGAVYSLPVARADQHSGTKPVEMTTTSSWTNLWSSLPRAIDESAVAYRLATPSNLGRRERVVDVRCGREHCLMLTSSGRVFAAAASTLSYPSRGQLGIPGLSWTRRPAGVPYDAPHHVTALEGRHVVAIAAGENHSVALDRQGTVWTWGDNTYGQLGFENDSAYAVADAPRPLDVASLYRGTGLVPRVTGIAAGGASTYFTADSVPQDHPHQAAAEVWACGQGVHGQLGTGKWAHVCGTPARIMALSALSEYDERARRPVPIRLAAMTVGATHAGAVLANDTRGGDDGKSVRWGADVMVWGGNEHYQLGTGRRSNANKPVYIAPLVGGGKRAGGRAGEPDGAVAHLPGAGEVDGDARLQLAPRGTVSVDGRKVSAEQRIVCGDHVTAVYTGAA
jgi:alpha-tubulin suppressor-like RCC1 family protein